MTMSRKARIACTALAVPFALVLTIPFPAVAQVSSSSTTAGTPLVQIIEAVSKKSGKSFIVDPRVSGNATLVGLDPSKVTYPELLTILQVHGYVAVESGDLVRIVPDAQGRSSPTPVIGANDKRADAEIVTRVFKVKSLPAAQLVPILRALLPQSAHLAAFPCTNELVVVDSYGNVRRIENIVASMDKGDSLTLPKCAVNPPQPSQVPPKG
jgi:general secretion pathway protein D